MKQGARKAFPLLLLPKEHAKLSAIAQSLGVSKAAYLRHCIRVAKVKPVAVTP